MTFEETANLLKSISDNTSKASQDAFELFMSNQRLDYESLQYYEKIRINKTYRVTDGIEESLVNFFNSGLTDSKYKMCLLRDLPLQRIHTFKEFKNGDLALVDRETNNIEAIFDTRPATTDKDEPDYDIDTGYHIGGMLNAWSLTYYPEPNHFYLFLTSDGNIMLLFDSVKLRNKISKVSSTVSYFCPLKSNFKFGPYYTIYDHLCYICELDKEVKVIRNKNNVELKCFDKTLEKDFIKDYNI